MIAGTKGLILMLKGIAHQILRGVNIKLKKSVLVNWRPAFFFFLNFKGSPSQEEHKTIFSGFAKSIDFV